MYIHCTLYITPCMNSDHECDVTVVHFCRLRVQMSLLCKAHMLYRQRIWRSNTSKSRYIRVYMSIVYMYNVHLTHCPSSQGWASGVLLFLCVYVCVGLFVLGVGGLVFCSFLASMLCTRISMIITQTLIKDKTKTTPRQQPSKKNCCLGWDLNPRPSSFRAEALPTELPRQLSWLSPNFP